MRAGFPRDFIRVLLIASAAPTLLAVACKKKPPPAGPTAAIPSGVVPHAPAAIPNIPPGYVRPSEIPFTFRMEWILTVVDSAIRGQHQFEWAEAVAYARAADPTAAELKAELPPYADESPELGRLYGRFIADVLAPDGPDWVGPDPRSPNPGSDPPPPTPLAGAAARLAQATRRENNDAASEIAALEFLGRTGASARPYLHLIVARMNSSTATDACRIAAVNALVRLATDLPEASDALLDAVLDPHASLPPPAIDAIHHWAGLAPHVPRALAATACTLLKSPDPQVRQRAARLCGALAAQSPVVATALTRALTDADPEVRKLAVAAFLRPDVQAAADTASLITTLRDTDPRIRRDAAQVLADRKADQEEVMDTLTAAVDSGNFIVREALVDALSAADQTHGSALAVLKTTAAIATDPTARAYAKAALKQVEARLAGVRTP